MGTHAASYEWPTTGRCARGDDGLEQFQEWSHHRDQRTTSQGDGILTRQAWKGCCIRAYKDKELTHWQHCRADVQGWRESGSCKNGSVVWSVLVHGWGRLCIHGHGDVRRISLARDGGP